MPLDYFFLNTENKVVREADKIRIKIWSVISLDISLGCAD